MMSLGTIDYTATSINIYHPITVGTSYFSKKFLEAAAGNSFLEAKFFVWAGNVLSMSLNNQGFQGLIEARVQGTQKAPFQVSITLDTRPPEVWEALIKLFAQDTHAVSLLLEGTIPLKMLDTLSSSTINLFPKPPQDLRATCSCTKQKGSCIHIAATCYALSGALDRDPLLLFYLRGCTKQEFRERLVNAHNAIKREAQQYQLEKQITKPFESFWNYTSKKSLMQAPKPPATDAAPVLRYGKFPFQARQALTDHFFSIAYQIASAAALKKLQK